MVKTLTFLNAFESIREVNNVVDSNGVKVQEKERSLIPIHFLLKLWQLREGAKELKQGLELELRARPKGELW